MTRPMRAVVLLSAMITSSLGFVALPAAVPFAAREARMNPTARFGHLSARAGGTTGAYAPQAACAKGACNPARRACSDSAGACWVDRNPVVLGSYGGGAGWAPRTAGGALMASPLSEIPNTPPSKDAQRVPLVYGESTARSFVKALAWRLTAGVVTLVSGLVFSGSLATAMSIVGSDFVTKSGFMFAGERLWNRVKWGQDKSGDSAKRSLAKAVMWRVFAASNTLICGIFLAKDLSVASKIAGTDTVFKTSLFFLNERLWTKINWGKEYEPEYYL